MPGTGDVLNKFLVDELRHQGDQGLGVRGRLGASGVSSWSPEPLPPPHSHYTCRGVLPTPQPAPHFLKNPESPREPRGTILRPPNL